MRKLDSSVRSSEDCINPDKFRDITQAVKNLAGHNEDTGRYITPSLALKLGHCLKRCAKILKSKALQHADPVMKARATDFNDLCVLEWSQNVSSAALTTLQQRKWHKPTTLPISSDVSIVHRYVTARIRECAATIQQESQNPAVQYSMLSSALLCQLVMCNRRRSGEAERMKVRCCVAHMVKQLNCLCCITHTSSLCFCTTHVLTYMVKQMNCLIIMLCCILYMVKQLNYLCCIIHTSSLLPSVYVPHTSLSNR